MSLMCHTVSAAWLQNGLCMSHERSRSPQGSLRVNRFNPYEGYVGSESVGQDILLAGRAAMNRALDGDIVAVELLPEEQWSSASTQLRKHDDAQAPADEVILRLWPAVLNAASHCHSHTGLQHACGLHLSRPVFCVLSSGATRASCRLKNTCITMFMMIQATMALYAVQDAESREDADLEREAGGASLVAQVAPGEHYEDSAGSGEKRPTGRVVGIIRRNWRTRGYSGSLQPDRLGRPAKQGPSNVLFCPVERRFPFIRIQTRQVPSLVVTALSRISTHHAAVAQSSTAVI